MKDDKTIPLAWAIMVSVGLWLVIIVCTSAIVEFAHAHIHPR